MEYITYLRKSKDKHHIHIHAHEHAFIPWDHTLNSSLALNHIRCMHSTLGFSKSIIAKIMTTKTIT